MKMYSNQYDSYIRITMTEQEVDDPSPQTSSSTVLLNSEDQGKKIKSYSYQKKMGKYVWLDILNKEKGRAFCKVCEKFYTHNQGALQKSKSIFITIPFTNFRKADGKTGKLSKHATFENHTKAVNFTKCFDWEKINLFTHKW